MANGRFGWPSTPAAFDPQLHIDSANAFWDSTVDATYARLTDLPSTAPVGKQAWVQEVAALYIFNGTSWQTLSPSSGNLLVNGGFDLWQRGLSAFTSPGYTADRWTLITGTAVSAIALAASPGDFCTYAMKITATASTNAFGLAQAIESAIVNRVRGRYVTFGIDLQMSSGTQQVTVALQQSATADSSTATFSNLATNTVAVTTTRTRFYVSAFVPANASAAGLRVLVSGSNLASGAYVLVRAAQLELGQFANAFQPQMPNVQAELAAANRYYVRLASAKQSARLGPMGYQITTSQGEASVVIMPMRSDAVTVTPVNLWWTDGVSGNVAVSSVAAGPLSTWGSPTTGSFTAYFNFAAAFGATSRPGLISAASATGGYLEISAEI